MSLRNRKFMGKRSNNSKNFQHRKPKHFKSGRNDRVNNQEREWNQLTEPEVGITEYISNLDGFSAIIKARFSDFQVNEIDLDGKVAKLTDTSIPKDFTQKQAKIDFSIIETSPVAFVPQNKWEEIKNMMETDTSAPVELEIENLSKEERTEIHLGIKKYFGKKIIASTLNKEDKKVILLKRNEGQPQDERVQWPKDKGEFVYFLVYKESLNTMEACLLIANSIRMSPSRFTYAGVKDKRAKTTQWFCVRKVEPWKLVKRTCQLQNIKVGNFEFKDKVMKLGDLTGNRFRIALRNVEASDEHINKAMEQLKGNGFINYYGLQRFGNDKDVPTFLIGVNLLKGNWKEAVELILKLKQGTSRDHNINTAKTIYQETGDAKKALESLEEENSASVERKLLEGLAAAHENDYVNALENIPRNMRLLYIHSFQSLIWNKMVSKRIKEYGLQPLEGDLVLGEDSLRNEEVTDDENVTDCEDDKQEKIQPKVLGKDDLPNYTIFDIVLPLPGNDIIYPEYMKPFYKEALEEYGLSLEMPAQSVKCYNLGGNYRKIMQQVKDLSWKIMYYDHPNDNLILSDLEQLQGHPEPKSREGGKYKALIVEVTLNCSSYATMILREILKTDTSSHSQAKLNDYHNVKKTNTSPDKTEEKPVEDIQIRQPESLLSDKQKFDEFKNSIFQNILEEPGKRKCEDEDESTNKRIKEEETEKKS